MAEGLKICLEAILGEVRRLVGVRVCDRCADVCAALKRHTSVQGSPCLRRHAGIRKGTVDVECAGARCPSNVLV